MVDFAGIGSVLSGLSGFGSLFGGSGGLSARKSAALEAAYAREFAQNQIQWKVQDAKNAGVHPLYALGAPAVSFSPSFGGAEPKRNVMRDLSEAGAGISRAAGAFADSKQRAILFDQETRLNELKIKDAEIAVQKNASDLVMSRTGQVPAIDGSRILLKPSEVTHSRGDDHALEAGRPAPATKQFVNRDGTVSVWPSADAKQSIEDSLYELEHMYRNRIAPYFQSHGRSIRRAWDNVWWNPSRGRR